MNGRQKERREKEEINENVLALLIVKEQKDNS
jgi:hypothetical protein